MISQNRKKYQHEEWKRYICSLIRLVYEQVGRTSTSSTKKKRMRMSCKRWQPVNSLEMTKPIALISTQMIWIAVAGNCWFAPGDVSEVLLVCPPRNHVSKLPWIFMLVFIDVEHQQVRCKLRWYFDVRAQRNAEKSEQTQPQEFRWSFPQSL